MQRRSFLVGTVAAGAAALGSAAGFQHWQEMHASIESPGQAEGHLLRDALRNPAALPPPSASFKTDVVIIGSGIAGLSAAWKLKREGHADFLVIKGPEHYGNAAAGHFGDLAYPTGAHYLPIPSQDLIHVRELLHDMGVILRNPGALRPYYDERYLMHAPEERLLRNGIWQEGLLPTHDVPADELEQQARFFKEIERMRSLRGNDGKRPFNLPSALSSSDPAWLALDRISFRQWLQQHGYSAPTLLWYLDYCCRDDYGSTSDRVSAWAGLHYFCSRFGEAENAEKGAWLTWPDGLYPLAHAMAQSAGQRQMNGSAFSVKVVSGGVEVRCVEMTGRVVRTYTVQARKAICAMPLFVAARIVPHIRDYGFDPQQHMPVYAPWMVSSFLMKKFPQELPEAPLSWDNVAYGGEGLGYTVSTHQDLRQRPPDKTVFTAYRALSHLTPDAARRWLMTATPDELLSAASIDLKTAYGWKFAPCVERVNITLRGHAMASPAPGFRSNAGLQALRGHDGAILFAHADLSGFSLFEEASWWGYRAAIKALA